MTNSFRDFVDAKFASIANSARVGVTNERLLEMAAAIAEPYRADGSVDLRAAASFEFTAEFSADGEVQTESARILKLFDARELQQAGLLPMSPVEPMDERP